MAARLDIYSIAPGTTLVGVDEVLLEAAGADRLELPDLEGWVSASDDDEQELFEVLGVIADNATLDARALGDGSVEACDVATLAGTLRTLAAASAGLHAAWLSALASATSMVERRGACLGWRMRYDQAGTTDSGPEEFPTAWS